MIAANIDREELGRLALEEGYRHANRLRLAAKLRRLSWDAPAVDDVVQDGVATALQTWAPEKGTLESWVRAKVSFAYLDVCHLYVGRRSHRHIPTVTWPILKLDSGDEEPFQAEAPRPVEDIRLAAVEAAMRKLPPRLRDAVEACYLRDVPQCQYMRQVGKSSSRVSQMLAQAVNEIRAILGEAAA